MRPSAFRDLWPSIQVGDQRASLAFVSHGKGSALDRTALAPPGSAPWSVGGILGQDLRVLVHGMPRDALRPLDMVEAIGRNWRS